jgi:hypothetical protein
MEAATADRTSLAEKKKDGPSKSAWIIVRSGTLGVSIGGVPFTEGFLSSGCRLGFRVWPTSLEFFPPHMQ